MKNGDIIRLAHFSDIHLFREVAWKASDYFSKRLTGRFNHKYLGRGKRFANAEEVIVALTHELEAIPFDLSIFSGDSSTFGIAEEIDAAARSLPLHLPGLAVPGNHDYYTGQSRQARYFETAFARWQQGERVNEQTYPFTRNVGNYHVIGVNSATENRGFWDARGRVGQEQLDRLEKLCKALVGPKILVTHYPLILRNGQPERKGRQLRDAQALAEVITPYQFIAWLHGHQHRGFWLSPSEKRPFALICCGSTTQEQRMMYHDLQISPQQITIHRRIYRKPQKQFSLLDSVVLHRNSGEVLEMPGS
jgi:3',5'-cyclic AMP phosphodiesterase CpdA